MRGHSPHVVFPGSSTAAPTLPGENSPGDQQEEHNEQEGNSQSKFLHCLLSCFEGVTVLSFTNPTYIQSLVSNTPEDGMDMLHTQHMQERQDTSSYVTRPCKHAPLAHLLPGASCRKQNARVGQQTSPPASPAARRPGPGSLSRVRLVPQQRRRLVPPRQPLPQSCQYRHFVIWLPFKLFRFTPLSSTRTTPWLVSLSRISSERPRTLR